jgi:hypothetical protein
MSQKQSDLVQSIVDDAERLGYFKVAIASSIAEALASRAVQPMSEADTVQIYGVKDGAETLLGTAPMPPRMMARQLAREQFGHFEDDDGSDAELCFGAMEQLIDHMQRAAHHAATQPQQEGTP